MSSEFNSSNNAKHSPSNCENTNNQKFQLVRPNFHKTLQGCIHLGQDTTNSKFIIIKQTNKKLVLSGIGCSGNKISEDFLEECRILNYLSLQKDINNKGICTIYNNYLCQDNLHYYYAMEYHETDLFDYINSKYQYFKVNNNLILNHNIWINEIQNIFKQICYSVAYIHHKGIAHMDLSLENILLDIDATGCGTGIPKTYLIDFGVAHDINKPSNGGSWISCKSRIGKLHYMSPEVFSASPNIQYDCRSADIWSLGVILFIMMAGCKPYNLPFIYTPNSDNKYKGDILFTYLLKGHIDDILKKLGKRSMFDDDAVDLLKKIFTLQKNRITMNELLRHPFVGIVESQQSTRSSNNLSYTAKLSATCTVKSLPINNKIPHYNINYCNNPYGKNRN